MHRWGDGTMDLYHQILLPCRMYVRPNIHFLVVQNISTSTSTSAYSLFSFLFNLNLYLYPPHEHCSNTSQYVSFGPINSINSINSINPNKAHNLTVRLPHLPPPLAEFGPDHPSPITHHPSPITHHLPPSVLHINYPTISIKLSIHQKKDQQNGSSRTLHVQHPRISITMQ